MKKRLKERWRDIPGFEEMYQASSAGRVRSVDRIVPRGNSPFKHKGRVLKPRASKTSGYLYVNLGSHALIGVHIAVLSTFVSERPEGLEGCHKDGNKLNNYASNLKWATHKENESHKRKHGTLNQGTKNGSACLSKRDVVKIRQSYSQGKSTLKELGERYDVTPSTIGYVVRRETWTHIDDKGHELSSAEQASYISRLKKKDRAETFSAHGKILTVKEWSKEIGVATGTLWARLRRGWSLEETFAKGKY